MIYDIPHVTKFGDSWSNLKIQWETVHLFPIPREGQGLGFIFLDYEWLMFIKSINTPQAFQWMIGDAGTIIWGIKDKKHLDNYINKPRMPVLAIGGNKLRLLRIDQVKQGWGEVSGMPYIDPTFTPGIYPEYWHRIWCVTKLRKGQVSPPHDTPRGPAYLPIVDVRAFKRSKSLSAGRLFCHYA